MDITSNIEFARDTTPECRANSVRRIAGTIVVITIAPARDLRAIQTPCREPCERRCKFTRRMFAEGIVICYIFRAFVNSLLFGTSFSSRVSSVRHPQGSFRFT